MPWARGAVLRIIGPVKRKKLLSPDVNAQATALPNPKPKKARKKSPSTAGYVTVGWVA